MKAFRNQTALITGASSGVGKAIALALAAQGARICVVGRRKGALAELAPERSYVADLSSVRDVARLAARLRKDLGALDILVHSASVHAVGGIESAALGRLDEQYRVNVRAPFALTQTLLPALRARRGQVVFVNSSVAHAGKARLGQYAATKSAQKALANSLRDEVNGDGLRVLNVFLGRTATPMQAESCRQEGREYHPELLLQPEDIASVVVHALGLPRTAEMTDVHLRPAVNPH